MRYVDVFAKHLGQITAASQSDENPERQCMIRTALGEAEQELHALQKMDYYDLLEHLDSLAPGVETYNIYKNPDTLRKSMIIYALIGRLNDIVMEELNDCRDAVRNDLWNMGCKHMCLIIFKILDGKTIF